MTASELMNSATTATVRQGPHAQALAALVVAGVYDGARSAYLADLGEQDILEADDAAEAYALELAEQALHVVRQLADMTPDEARRGVATLRRRLRVNR